MKLYIIISIHQYKIIKMYRNNDMIWYIYIYVYIYMYIYSHNCLYFNFKHAQQSGLCGHYVLCVGVLKGSCSAPLDMWCLWRYPCLEWLPSSRCCDVGFCWMWKCVSETVDIALSRQNIPNSVGEGISWRKLCQNLGDHTRTSVTLSF